MTNNQETPKWKCAYCESGKCDLAKHPAPTPQVEEWEKEFGRKFVYDYFDNTGLQILGNRAENRPATDDEILDFIRTREQQAYERGRLEINTEKEQEWYKAGYDEGASEERERIVEGGKKMEKEELFVGETQYRFYKGNIAWVYNQGVNDLLTFIKNLA